MQINLWSVCGTQEVPRIFFFFSSLLLSSLELSDTKVYEPQIRAFAGAAADRSGEAARGVVEGP